MSKSCLDCARCDAYDLRRTCFRNVANIEKVTVDERTKFLTTPDKCTANDILKEFMHLYSNIPQKMGAGNSLLARASMFSSSTSATQRFLSEIEGAPPQKSNLVATL